MYYLNTTLRTLLATATIAALAGVFGFALPHAAQAQTASCELDIALVIDSSGSISNTELSDMQNAFGSFVDTILADEPNTHMTVIDFDASASIEQDWTNVAADIKNGINSGTSGGLTNWEDAINTAQSQFPHRTANNPDVMIFASDGNPNEPGSDANALSAAQTAANNAQAAGTFIKTIGIGNDIDGPNLDSISSDGSHIDSDFDQLETDLLALAETLCDEVVGEEGNGGGDDTVVNNNEAHVTNITGAEAKTGGNWAGGSTGGDGGSGGDVENDGDNQNMNGSGTGDGGTGGDSGNGGTIVTGDARANASTVNVVNTNTTRLDRCACEGDGEGDTMVRNRNHAVVFNATFARAKTGHNDADGSEGGEGGDGGDVENDAGQGEGSNQNVNNSGTGDGGSGGSSAEGGLVQTGDATARSETRNVVNRNTTRILR